MIVKKKLKNITVEEYKKWENIKGCNAYKCSECPLQKVTCNSGDRDCWIYNKNLYSNKFLNQEIEVEVPNIKVAKSNSNILDETEREYLKAVIMPFRNRISFIRKEIHGDCKKEYIKIYLDNRDCFRLAYFKKGKKYKNMKLDKKYSIEDLKL